MYKANRLSTVVPALVSTVLCSHVFAREWHDRFGQTFKGTLVDVTADKALLKSDLSGKLLNFDIDNFSRADRDYLQEVFRRKQLKDPFSDLLDESTDGGNKSKAPIPERGEKAKPEEGKFREWKTIQGKSISGKFQSTFGGTVLIAGKAGVQAILVKDLSADDRKFVDELLGGKTATPERPGEDDDKKQVPADQNAERQRQLKQFEVLCKAYVGMVLENGTRLTAKMIEELPENSREVLEAVASFSYQTREAVLIDEFERLEKQKKFFQPSTDVPAQKTEPARP